MLLNTKQYLRLLIIYLFLASMSDLLWNVTCITCHLVLNNCKVVIDLDYHGRMITIVLAKEYIVHICKAIDYKLFVSTDKQPTLIMSTNYVAIKPIIVNCRV